MTIAAKKIIRGITRLIAPLIPLWIYRRLLQNNPTSFFYHVVSDEDLPHIKHLYPYKNAAAFESDLLYLKRSFILISYPDLLDQFNGEKSLPKKAAHLSFDDGFAECYSVIRPLLLKHEIPATFFLATDFIDNQKLFYRGKTSLCMEKINHLDPPSLIRLLRQVNQTFDLQLETRGSLLSWLKSLRQPQELLVEKMCGLLEIDIKEFLEQQQPYLTTEQIRAMHQEGFTFGAHTRKHHKLIFLSQSEQASEIIASCQQVCTITGEQSVPFAFPFSGATVDRGFLTDLRASNPEVGLFFDINKFRHDLPFIINRIWVDKPIAGIPAERNVLVHLHRAYQWSLVDQVNRR